MSKLAVQRERQVMRRRSDLSAPVLEMLARSPDGMTVLELVAALSQPYRRVRYVVRVLQDRGLLHRACIRATGRSKREIVFAKCVLASPAALPAADPARPYAMALPITVGKGMRWGNIL